MAVVNTVGKTTTTITDIQVGDVFEVIRAVGCRKAGELLVVKSTTDSHGLSFFGGASGGNYGSIDWLQTRIDAGELIYRPHVPK